MPGARQNTRPNEQRPCIVERTRVDGLSVCQGGERFTEFSERCERASLEDARRSVTGKHGIGAARFLESRLRHDRRSRQLGQRAGHQIAVSAKLRRLGLLPDVRRSPPRVGAFRRAPARPRTDCGVREHNCKKRDHRN